MTGTQELLAEPVSGPDLAAEIEQAGRPIGKLTLLLIAVLLVAGGVLAGRSTSTGSGPASVQPSQNGSRTQQQGGCPGGGQGGGFPAG
ncbi:hypothetical protein [Amycolatopsis sp.]|uniref:hypothetical protein n=1 Tax=Amycolatopsis sp. TaxID=37632 RepID=UPI002C94D6E8|nr:hypothetical protein [Amycolatopsis sp.]HVV11841.1 hypothetical protein [Amycolatopsis sp.]